VMGNKHTIRNAVPFLGWRDYTGLT